MPRSGLHEATVVTVYRIRNAQYGFLKRIGLPDLYFHIEGCMGINSTKDGFGPTMKPELPCVGDILLYELGTDGAGRPAAVRWAIKWKNPHGVIESTSAHRRRTA